MTAIRYRPRRTLGQKRQPFEPRAGPQFCRSAPRENRCYAHCCGSTRRASNGVLESAYSAHPEWQSYDDPDACAVIGRCPDDSMMSAATCTDEPEGRCVLVDPTLCVDLDCETCPFGFWQDNAGCATCCCGPPPLTMVTASEEHPAELVTVVGASSTYEGESFRTELVFSFHYDDPEVTGNEEAVTVRVELLHPPVGLPLPMATFVLDSTGADAGIRLGIPTYERAQSDVTISLEIAGGYLSIRPGSTGFLDGGLYATMTDGTVVGGAFAVTDPWLG
ncbi:MAG: hypothetical protein JW751_04915 [Polyangiaceae bacterium]|nr:hypothetical protein [Polyangiaceae bacterium]